MSSLDLSPAVDTKAPKPGSAASWPSLYQVGKPPVGQLTTDRSKLGPNGALAIVLANSADVSGCRVRVWCLGKGPYHFFSLLCTDVPLFVRK